MNRYLSLFAFTCGLAVSGWALANDGSPAWLDVSSGTASFEVATNVPGVEVKGKTSVLTGRAQVESGSQGLTLQQMEAVIPVRGLSTGMKVRDEHMRKFIFTTADGQVPDIAFSADSGLCKPAAANREIGCQISGVMKIRGASHPVTLNVVAKQESGAVKSFRATADSIIRLTDFNIEAPSQFGVKPSNEVKVHLEFLAKEKAGALTALGAGK